MTPQYIEINKLGDKRFYKDKAMNILHREDGPAVEYADGNKSWYLNGKLHREDGPAIEYAASGTKAWALNNRLHREDGPAVEYADGSKSWYLNGKLHREDAPAVEYVDGSKEWCLNGKRHREDGPAIEYVDGSKSWHLNGVRYTEEEFKKNIKDHKLKLFAMGVLNILSNHEEWDADVLDKIVDSSVDFGVANFTVDDKFNVL